jgi:hypothetical protein
MSPRQQQLPWQHKHSHRSERAKRREGRDYALTPTSAQRFGKHYAANFASPGMAFNSATLKELAGQLESRKDGEAAKNQ